MTTRKFSAITLPHPKYSFEIGCFDSWNRKTVNLSTWLPKFSHFAQLLEVRRAGSLLRDNDGKCGTEFVNTINHLISHSYCVIENARLELFLRRDFISQFVNHGLIHLMRLGSPSDGKAGRWAYEVYTSGNTMTIILSEKQYRRFGIVAKRVISANNNNNKVGEKRYRVDIELGDEKLKTSDKYLDKMVMTLRRLDPVGKLYFRFVPNDQTKMTLTKANEMSLEFFRYVIDEYAKDGHQPVPLTGCSRSNQKVPRQWTNFSQLHPPLSAVGRIGRGIESLEENNATTIGIQRNVEILNEVVGIVDWLGYQALSLDCNRQELQSGYYARRQVGDVDSLAAQFGDSIERVDVSCALIPGLFDCHHIQDNLDCAFNKKNSTSNNDYILRALILHVDGSDGGGGGVGGGGAVLLQHCASSLITVATFKSDGEHY